MYDGSRNGCLAMNFPKTSDSFCTVYLKMRQNTKRIKKYFPPLHLHVRSSVSWTPYRFPHSGHLNLDPFWKSIQMSTLLSSWSNLISLIYHGSRHRSLLNSSSGVLCYYGEVVYYLPAKSWRDPLSSVPRWIVSYWFTHNNEILYLCQWP